MRRPPRWGVSPSLPAAANALLALLWIFSSIGGWGADAFCTADPGCLDDYRPAIRLSLAMALPAAIFSILGWLLLRDQRERLDTLLMATAALWVAAEATLFIGGHLLT